MDPIRHPGLARSEQAEDELAIMRLMAAQEQAITENDRALYLATFEPDAAVVNPFGEFRGHAAIGEFFAHMQQVVAPGVRDVVLNFVIHTDGATARSSATTLVIRGLSPPAELIACTTATSLYGKDEHGVWRLRRHEIRADRSFVPEVGATSEIIARLTARVAQLEQRLGIG
jgi:ketosteroid isomerase-like protein